MVEISVKSKRVYSGEGEYVGRPNVLGNPYKIEFPFSRQEVIDYYAQYIANAIKANDPNFMSEFIRLFQILINKQSLILICWCSPKPCHADVIKQILLNKYHTGSWLVNGKVYETMERCSRGRRN